MFAIYFTHPRPPDAFGGGALGFDCGGAGLPRPCPRPTAVAVGRTGCMPEIGTNEKTIEVGTNPIAPP
jgi:hypothetical protein